MKVKINRKALTAGLLIVYLLPLVDLCAEADLTSKHPTPFDQFIPRNSHLVIYLPELAQIEKRILETPIGDFLRDANSQPWREAVTEEWETLTQNLFDPLPIIKNSASALFLAYFPERDAPFTTPTLPIAFLFKSQQGKEATINDYINNLLQGFVNRYPQTFQYTEEKLNDFRIISLKWREKGIALLAFQGNYFIFTPDKVLLNKLISSPKRNHYWLEALSRFYTQGDDIFIWFDHSQALAQLLSASRHKTKSEQIEALLRVLGIKQIKYIYLATRFQKGEVWTRLGCLFDEERAGLFSLFKPTQSLPIIETVNLPGYSYAGFSFISPQENLRLSRERAKELGGEQAAQQIDMALAMVQLFTGLNLEQDVLSLFGTQSAFVFKSLLEGAMVTELINPQKFDQLIRSVSQRFQLKKIDYNYAGLHYFQIVSLRSRLPLFFARGEKHLVLSTNQLLIRNILTKINKLEKSQTSQISGEETTGTLVAQFYSAVSDSSMLTTLGDVIVARLNKEPGVIKRGGINPLLVPDFTVMMDHSFPAETTIVAEKDLLELRSRSAFGFGVLPITLFPFIGTVANITAADFLSARDLAHARICQENLVKIDAAKEQWALEQNLPYGTLLPSEWLGRTDVVGATGYIKKKPICPERGIYKINPIGVDPECSIGTTLNPQDNSLWHKLPPFE